MEITDNSAIADAIFGSGLNKSARLGNLALRELDKGLGQFTSKNYELAITSFSRAIRLSPGTDTAINAYDYMARAQLSQGNPDAAIVTYQKALKIAFPEFPDQMLQILMIMARCYVIQPGDGEINPSRRFAQLARDRSDIYLYVVGEFAKAFPIDIEAAVDEVPND